MKNRVSLLMMGAILVMAWGCNSQSSSSAKSPCTNHSPSQSDTQDDDGDDGAYGDHDTSTLRVVDEVSPENPTYDLADQSELMGHAVVAIAEALDTAEGESSPVVLESVSSVDVSADVVASSEE